jgi:hypothetical protein
MFTAWYIACGVQLSGRVIISTYFHFSKLGMTLKARGTFPDRYVANILPISPYTLLTSGLSKDLLLAYFSFSSNLFSQSSAKLLLPVNPRMFRILNYASVAPWPYFFELKSIISSSASCCLLFLMGTTFPFRACLIFLRYSKSFCTFDVRLRVFYFLVSTFFVGFVLAFSLFLTIPIVIVDNL